MRPRSLRPSGTQALLAAGLSLVLFPPAAAGQTPATPATVLALPASTRGMALGGAYMMNAGHADAVFHHPALLAGATGFGLDVQRWGGAASAAAASAATAWLGGGVGVGVQVLNAGLDRRSGGDAGPIQDPLLVHGPVPLAEQVATLGYARRIFGLQVGITGKLVDLRLDGARSSTVLADVGAARALGPVTVGLTVKDLGNDPFESGGNHAPARILLGAGAYGQQAGPLDLGIAGALSHGAGGTRVGGGVELGYWPVVGRTLVARAGVESRPGGSDVHPFTFGFAFWGDRVVVEWAYRGFADQDAGTHRFGVRWR